MKKIIPILIITIIISVVVAIFINNQNRTLPVVSEIECNSDSDCVVASKQDSKNLCCGTCDSEAISKDAQAKRSKWLVKNCQKAPCPIFDCYNEKIAFPRCINNTCEIKWVERNSLE